MTSTSSTSLPHRVIYQVYTLYLFTRSDMKTILFPICLFAWCTVPKTSSIAYAHSVFWTWLHLLQFCVSNQSLSPDEDARNKPWRPIPSRRLSLHHATALRWFLLPLCLYLSWTYDVLCVGIILMLGILLHNELKLDSHWFTRNVLNAIGYAVFDAGAMTIAQIDSALGILPAAVSAHYLSVAIVLTTIHAQDFRDEAGDRLEKRGTIPIVMPRVGRLSMPVTLTFWSAVLCTTWRLSLWSRSALLLTGVSVGARFYFLRSPAADRTSYLLYNIWLALARISPIYG